MGESSTALSVLHLNHHPLDIFLLLDYRGEICELGIGWFVDGIARDFCTSENLQLSDLKASTHHTHHPQLPTQGRQDISRYGSHKIFGLMIFFDEHLRALSSS
jgi:hypothetical protein